MNALKLKRILGQQNLWFAFKTIIVLQALFGSATGFAQSDGGFVGKLGELPNSPFLERIMGRTYGWEEIGERELQNVMEQMRMVGRNLPFRETVLVSQIVVRRVLLYPSAFRSDYRRKVGSWWLDRYNENLRGRPSTADSGRCLAAFEAADAEAADLNCGNRDLDFSFFAAAPNASYDSLRISRASRFGMSGVLVRDQPWFSLAWDDASRIMAWLDGHREKIGRGDERLLREAEREASEMVRFVLELLVRRTLDGANGKDSAYPDHRWNQWTEREREQVGAWWLRFAESFAPKLNLEAAGCHSAFRNADIRRAETNCNFIDLGLRLR